MEEKYEKYQKIYESSKEWILTKSENQKSKRIKWCVTEKAHGSNFLFVVSSGSKIKCGKRRSLLDDSEYFFGFQENVLPKYSGYMFKIFELLSPCEEVWIYGEIIGGFYPHKDLKEQEQGDISNSIQSGIWYCPTIEFYAFDLAVKQQKGEFKIVDYEKSLEVFEKVGLPHAKPLLVGKFEKCIHFKLGFDSIIPGLFNLPLLSPNKAEGVVVKPMKEFTVTTRKGCVRPILKLKIEEFSEKKYDNVKKNEKMESKSNFGSNGGTNMSKKNLLMFEVNALVNENRLQSAVSKVGKIEFGKMSEKKFAKKLLIEMKNDVFEDLVSENEKDWNDLRDYEKSPIEDEIEKLCKEIIISYVKMELKRMKKK